MQIKSNKVNWRICSITSIDNGGKTGSKSSLVRNKQVSWASGGILIQVIAGWGWMWLYDTLRSQLRWCCVLAKLSLAFDLEIKAFGVAFAVSEMFLEGANRANWIVLSSVDCLSNVVFASQSKTFWLWCNHQCFVGNTESDELCGSYRMFCGVVVI